jgi:NAD(P)-dependent dehydrogenase (short-subunit alcohol dehydrogenase family)
VRSGGRDAYNVAKGGLLALISPRAVEYAKDHVWVNVLASNATLTERVRKFLTSNPRTQGNRRQTPYWLSGIRRTFARIRLFLASDDVRRITGVVVPVDSNGP